ncbi:hypothetical protein GC102_10970 [Paenibacillus sp. LMG 31460]|uniref:Uncharacterized protein n=2 Tax=Paenibacillus germinis TaxID=2654979 RepID=A0ABX1YZB2_9BACL|nr:hypothetical protein [Paenibacillus germinis]NOU86292.1 hypothetical protein [Paenibacillus germinis]
MKRMPFERPTEHYDERIFNIDEQICSLLKQRKEISGNNPGFPPFEYISKWASAFELYEDFLKAVFGSLRSEEHFKPMVEPSGFRKHIPVLQSIEKGAIFYSVTSIRQYNNASVITFSIDWDMTTDLPSNPHKHSHFELYLGEKYDCRMTNGGSTSGHSSYNYVVSPPLTDDISGIELMFKEYSAPFKNRPTGIEIVFRVE